MGIYYSVTVGVGFEVPLEAIQALPNYEENGESAYETLDDFLYRHYPDLCYATAHSYDALDEETSFVVAVGRLTETYDLYQSQPDLVILDSKDPELTDVEKIQIMQASKILTGEYQKAVPFVASSVS